MPAPETMAVFALASLALIAFPGPSVFYILARSFAGGRRAGLVSMLGVEAGGLVHVSAATLISRSLSKPGTYTGFYPFDEHAAWKRNAAELRRLGRAKRGKKNG